MKAALAFRLPYYGQLLGVFRQETNPARPLSLWRSSKTVSLIHSVRDYTAIMPYRLAALHRLVREVDRRGVPGDVVECGVYNGGSASILASACTCSPLDRKVWLFDSFEGLPSPTDKDGDKARECFWWCHGDLARVGAIFRKLRIPESRVKIVKGWFNETFPTVDIRDIALLHIDADWYESVRLCFETFYNRVSPGGYIVIDDYGHWEGCRRATEEFLEQRSISVELVRVDYTGRYFQKPQQSDSPSAALSKANST